jgi:carbohydrate-selective porin OprB
MARGHTQFALAVGLLAVVLALGVPTGPQATEQEQGVAAEEMRLAQRVDHTGGRWNRTAFSGNWDGIRQTLMEKGIRFDPSLIQTMQGNWAGGTADKSPYRMNAGYGIQLDTGKAGLWPPGGMLVLKGESKYRKSNNGETGALLPIKTLSLYPAPQDDVTDLYTTPFEFPGDQRLGWTWSDKSRIQFEWTPRSIIGAIITGSTTGLERKSSDWAFVYDFDQYLYAVPGEPEQGFGLFGRFGLTNGEVNPVQQFYSIGVGGKRVILGRDRDTFGIGYYYLVLSDKLPKLIQHGARGEQDGELGYNIAVTPWLRIAPDLEIVSPARKSAETTPVAGVRVKIAF